MYWGVLRGGIWIRCHSQYFVIDRHVAGCRLFFSPGHNRGFTDCFGIVSDDKMNWFKYSSPKTFYPLAGKLMPWFAAAAVCLTVAGLYVGFFMAPTDAQQGEGYRIIFLHVPVSWMSMFIYVVMAFWAAVGLKIGRASCRERWAD